MRGSPEQAFVKKKNRTSTVRKIWPKLNAEREKAKNTPQHANFLAQKEVLGGERKTIETQTR